MCILFKFDFSKDYPPDMQQLLEQMAFLVYYQIPYILIKYFFLPYHSIEITHQIRTSAHFSKTLIAHKQVFDSCSSIL